MIYVATKNDLEEGVSVLGVFDEEEEYRAERFVQQLKANNPRFNSVVYQLHEINEMNEPEHAVHTHKCIVYLDSDGDKVHIHSIREEDVIYDPDDDEDSEELEPQMAFYAEEDETKADLRKRALQTVSDLLSDGLSEGRLEDLVDEIDENIIPDSAIPIDYRGYEHIDLDESNYW